MTSAPLHHPDTSSAARPPLRIVVARGSRVSGFTVRPLAAGLVAGTCLLLIAGYLGAAGYLMLRDDIAGPSAIDQIRQARAYEDRIAELRARIDRITSRSLIAQETYEKRIGELTARQVEIDARHARVADVLARAARSGLSIAGEGPLPVAKPVRAAPTAPLPESVEAVGGTNVPIDRSVRVFGLRGSMTGTPPALAFAPAEPAAVPNAFDALLSTGSAATAPIAPASAPAPKSDAAPAAAAAAPTVGDPMVMSRIESALEVMDRQAETALDLIAVAAERRIARIERVAGDLGVDLDPAGDAIGGPFEPLAGAGFDDRIDRVERAVARLAALREDVRALPIGDPVRGAGVSSSYGPRVDPFLRAPAMHTGIDFRADHGTPILATARGTVVSAGRNGGYGLMVEIDHGNGIVTRYGHMSRIRVVEGEEVAAGALIGHVGSSGRSTGAHLHYETRLASGPVDPQAFLDAGEKLASLLD